MPKKINYPSHPVSVFPSLPTKIILLIAGIGLRRIKNNRPVNMRPATATPTGHVVNMRPATGLIKASGDEKKENTIGSHQYPPFADNLRVVFLVFFPERRLAFISMLHN